MAFAPQSLAARSRSSSERSDGSLMSRSSCSVLQPYSRPTSCHSERSSVRDCCALFERLVMASRSLATEPVWPSSSRRPSISLRRFEKLGNEIAAHAFDLKSAAGTGRFKPYSLLKLPGQLSSIERAGSHLVPIYSCAVNCSRSAIISQAGIEHQGMGMQLRILGAARTVLERRKKKASLAPVRCPACRGASSHIAVRCSRAPSRLTQDVPHEFPSQARC